MRWALLIVAACQPAGPPVRCAGCPPPEPGPSGVAGSPTVSHVPTQSYVEWVSQDAPVARPLAVFVDPEGGALEQIARDPDVTTFLNDRFAPLLLPSFGDQPTGTAAIYTADGCVLVAPFRPTSPEAWIGEANRAVLMPDAVGRSAPRAARRDCTP